MALRRVADRQLPPEPAECLQIRHSLEVVGKICPIDGVWLCDALAHPVGGSPSVNVADQSPWDAMQLCVTHSRGITRRDDEKLELRQRSNTNKSRSLSTTLNDPKNEL